MNQFLETGFGNDLSSVRDTVATGDRVGSSLAALDAGDEPAQISVRDRGSEKGRVLLLEDDVIFKETLSDCLAENGYTVVAVENGGEGVREVLGRDFTLVLCDLMMPGLRGDMFYRALERIRPDLCQRFVFMTGHQNDAFVNEFIKSVNGLVLWKPFSLKDLLDTVAVAETYRAFQLAAESAPTDPDGSRSSRSTDDFLTSGTACPEASAVAKILARGRTGPMPDRQSEVLPGLHAGRESRTTVLAGLAILLVLVAFLWHRFGDARDRADAASAKRQAVETEWTAISQKLQDAIAKRSKIKKAQSALAGISADREEPRWAPALQSIVVCAGPEIQLREVRSREKLGDEKVWTLLVGGVSTGSAPRIVVDRFRADLQREFDRIFRSGVSIRFERFEDLPDLPSALPGSRRGIFTIQATIRFDEKTGTRSKEGA